MPCGEQPQPDSNATSEVVDTLKGAALIAAFVGFIAAFIDFAAFGADIVPKPRRLRTRIQKRQRRLKANRRRPQTSIAYIPLEHFLAVASYCMPAFLQAASVLGTPANAGAVKATTRLKARIETNAFMMGPPMQLHRKQASTKRHHIGGCALPSVATGAICCRMLAVTYRRSGRLGFCNPIAH